MDKKTMYVRWNVLFCGLLLLMMLSAVDGVTNPQNQDENGFSGLDKNIFLIINPAEIKLDQTGLVNPGVLYINIEEYKNQLANLGFGEVILNPGERAIEESGITQKGNELAEKYGLDNPNNPLFPRGGGAGDLFNQKNGIEDALAGSPFDPTVDPGRDWADSVIGKNSPTSAKGQGGTDISSRDAETDQYVNEGEGDSPAASSSSMYCVSDYLPDDQPIANDYCVVVDFDDHGNPTDERSYQEANAIIRLGADDPDPGPAPNDNEKNNSQTDDKKTKAPVDDGSGTSPGDPNSAGYSLSGVYIEQKDNLDQVANDGGASSKINNKYKWLIDASKQPGFFVPGSGGYDVGGAGLGGDIGIVTYDRTGLPRINTEKKIPWYLQPMALPKDMGYASEVAAASEGESRTYEFSGENMMASSEAMGGLKAGDAVKNNVASGGVVRGP